MGLVLQQEGVKRAGSSAHSRRGSGKLVPYMGQGWGGAGLPRRPVEKNRLSMQERRVQSLGQEDPLEKDITNHSSILTWEIPGTEGPGRLEPMGLQRVRQDLATKQQKAKGLAQAQTRGLG